MTVKWYLVTAVLIVQLNVGVGAFNFIEQMVEQDPRLPENELKTKHYTSTTGFLYSKSPVHLMHLARFDRAIYTSFKSYTKILKKRLKIVQKYTDDFEKYSLNPGYASDDNETEEANLSWTTNISSHPITALRLVRRMTTMLPRVLQDIESGKETNLMNQIYMEKKQLDWPSAQDVAVITEAIYDLPLVYDKPVTYVSEAKDMALRETGLKVTLSASECSDIGVSAYNANRYASAVKWFEAGFNVHSREKRNTIPIEILENNLNYAIHDHDEDLNELRHEVKDLSHPWAWRHDLFTQNITGLKQFEGQAQTLRSLHESTYSSADTHPTVRFWRLCAGGNYQSTVERSSHDCFYQQHPHPYLILNPLKVEIHSRLPLVVQIYDLFSQSTAATVIAHALPFIESLNGIGVSRDLSGVNPQAHIPPIPATLDEYIIQDAQVQRFTNSLKFLTQMTGNVYPETSERLNVGVYSFVNYDAANDYFPASAAVSGTTTEDEETLTMHLFLNRMDSGGQSIFPRLGFSVQPIQGSALLWSSFKSNNFGHPIPGWTNCPVIAGNKWVASKYFRRVGRNLLRYTNIFDRVGQP